MLASYNDSDLIFGETFAIAGTKSRAYNSKKANFNKKKVDKRLAYIHTKIQVYIVAIDENDAKENPVKIKNIEKHLARLYQNKLRYEFLEEKLKESVEPQISTTDSDSRVLLVQVYVVEISFNIQSASMPNTIW